jgi:hypothetical protein
VYTIIKSALASCYAAGRIVYRFSGTISVRAIGKAAWTMAQAAQEEFGPRIKQEIVITKYGHAPKPLDGFTIYEAGHPKPDENTLTATAATFALGSVVKRKEDKSEIESGKKGIRAFSIASGDTSVLFKPPKYILNKMALLIQLSVISPYHLPTTLGRNNYLTTSCTGCVYYLVHVISSIYRQSRLLPINLPLRAAHRCNLPPAPLKL